MENNRLNYTYYNRRYIISGAIIVVMLVFLARLFFLQVVSDDYKKWADSNAIQRRTLYPSRGMIYDRYGNLLVYNQPSYDVMAVVREIQPFDTVDFCKTIGITKEKFDERMTELKNRIKTPGYSPNTAQVFMDQLPESNYGVLQEKLYRFPGFYIRNRALREYGCSNAANVLGYVNEVNSDDIENDDYYVQRDYTGRTGVERSYEKILRGAKGVEIMLRDSRGRIKGKFEEGKNDVAPVSGKNITLSIDMELQAFGEKIMQNKLGSIVMIEPATGEIICLVTSPTYDPSLLNENQLRQNFRLLERDQQKPLFDRSIKADYSPGSTFKPAQALIYLQDGVITKEKVYPCNFGYTFLGGHPACHGHYSPLNVLGSLSTSCNSFYCWGLHDMLDRNPRYPTVQEAYNVWRSYMAKMGFGVPVGVDLPGENGGFIPNSEYYDFILKNRRWASSNIISIAIGQGQINATPLQICNLAATIANRGHYITPHVVREIQDMPLEAQYRTPKPTGIDREYYEYVVEGMKNAVLWGTCQDLANLPGVEVCAKTGTVQNPHGRDHSACIAFAPMNNPKIAIAVYVQNGGAGRTVAIPMARLMLEKYLYGDLLEWDRWLETKMINWSTLPGSLNYIKKIVEDNEDAE